MRTCGTGWLDWGQARTALSGWDAVWVDLAGPHLAPIPDTAPDTTHIWAWSASDWARVRVDEGEAIIGYLHPDDTCPRGGTACEPTLLAEPMLADTWSETHIRVGDLAGTIWEMVEVPDGVATLFVRRR